MSLAALLAYCREHDIHASYRTKQEGPERFRAYVRTEKVSTNGVGVTREEALDRMAASVLDGLKNPWEPNPGGMGGAYEGIYGRERARDSPLSGRGV